MPEKETNIENNYVIPRNILDSVDIAGLMTRMAKADWYYDYTEDPTVWERGRTEINGIRDELLELSRHEQGAEVANHLWNAYVPKHAVQKPEFLLNEQNILSTKKSNTMIEKNLDYLKSNIRNHGFGETLGPELEAQLKKGAAEFTLSYKTEVNKKEIEATLHFGKSDKTDMYFFNRYDVRVNTEKDETQAQTFYINNGWGVTLKEAYNLLNGRAVHKELTNKENEKYQAWIQLDFGSKDKNGNYERKQFHQNYGYDLKQTLNAYPIKEMVKESDAKDLIRSLERGNLQMVTITTPEKDIRVFIEANPQFKSINVYDNKMNRLNQEKREELMKKPEKSEVNQKDQAKDKSKDKSLVQEGQDEKKLKNKKAEKVKEPDNGLVKKKRTKSAGKGMTM